MGRGANRAVVEPTRPVGVFGRYGEDWPGPDQLAIEAEALALGAPDWQPGITVEPDPPSVLEDDQVTVLDLPLEQGPRPQGAQRWSATPAPPAARPSTQPAPFRGYIPGQRTAAAAVSPPPARRWWVKALVLVVSLWILFGLMGAAVGVVAASLLG